MCGWTPEPPRGGQKFARWWDVRRMDKTPSVLPDRAGYTGWTKLRGKFYCRECNWKPIGGKCVPKYIP